MVAVVVVGLVILAFFLVGGMVGAVALIALGHWSARGMFRLGRLRNRSKSPWS